MTAQSQFAATLAQVRALADQLQFLADDHLGVDPEDVNWAHVGDAKRLLMALNQAVEPFMPVEIA